MRLKISPFASRVVNAWPADTFAASRRTFPLAVSVVMD
jgi:hypothetical protein